MIFEKNIAVIESSQLWKENKKDSRTWCSKVSLFNPKNPKGTEKVDEILMEEDQVCVSMCYCPNANNEQNNFLLLGCVKNLKYHPSFSLTSPSIKVY